MKLHVCTLINFILSFTLTSAFQAASPFSTKYIATNNVRNTCSSFSPESVSASTRTNRPTTHLSETLTSQVEDVLKAQYPMFHKLIMSTNADVWKELSEASADGFTVFAASDDAMRNLGDTKVSQLNDIRNVETAEKMAAYHAVNEPVGSEELFNSGGVVTSGGVVDILRSSTGGFMGIGGKEDGGMTVNGAKVLQSFNVDKAVIHEVDSLVSPDVLWRYCDQLRIPGSK